MQKNTIDEIRKVAVMLLYTDIVQTDIPYIVTHPFTTSSIVNINSELIDISQSDDNEQKWKKYMQKIINQSSLHSILMMMNKAYYLVFCKYIEKYLNEKELGDFLSSTWMHIENISGDKNVSIQEMIQFFKKANKKELMTKEEYEIYLSLPDKVKIYRGVTSYNKDNVQAMSWTLKKEVAEWFANRFQTGTGCVWEQELSKDRILAYFNRCNEYEVVVDLLK